MIEPGFERQREVLVKRPPASPQTKPIDSSRAGIAILRPLVNEDRHDGKPVVRLKKQVFHYLKRCRAAHIGRRIVDRSAEVAGRPSAILNAECVIAAVPFEGLMAQPERVSICRGNCSPSRSGRLWCVRNRTTRPKGPPDLSSHTAARRHCFSPGNRSRDDIGPAPDKYATANLPILTFRSSTPPP